MAEAHSTPNGPKSVAELLATVGDLPEHEQFATLHRHIASALDQTADPEQAKALLSDAVQHLEQACSGRVSGGVEVSASGLHLVLGYIEYLERCAISSSRAR